MAVFWINCWISRAWVLLGAAALMVMGWWMLRQTGSEFMPAAESREFYVDLEMPEGTQLERTAAAVSSLENIIRAISGESLEMIYSEIGPTSGLASGDRTCLMIRTWPPSR
jgi:HAE1 family hydrophobic/amphiphilic exporter-1